MTTSMEDADAKEWARIAELRVRKAEVKVIAYHVSGPGGFADKIQLSFCRRVDNAVVEIVTPHGIYAIGGKDFRAAARAVCEDSD